MELVVVFVAPIIFRAGQSFSENTQHWEHHVWGHILGDLLEVFDVYFFTLAEAVIQNGVHLFQRVDSLLEVLCTAALLGELTFPCDPRSPYDGHTTNENGNVFFCDKVVAVEIVDIEDKLDLLVERRTVKAEQAVQKLLLGEIPVAIRV